MSSNILITHTKSTSPDIVETERCNDWADLLDWLKQYTQLGVSITVLNWEYQAKPEGVAWSVLLLDPSELFWSIVWTGTEEECQKMVEYGMGKVLDGSDANAFMFMRNDAAEKFCKRVVG